MASTPQPSVGSRTAAPAGTRRAARGALQRWTHHLAVWVVLGGVLGAGQCRRRHPVIGPGGPDDQDASSGPSVLWDGLILPRPDADAKRIGHTAARPPIHHVIGI
ncbi:MAG TPA: hypothetical protein VH165_25235 [Kofleriaceae bacterium]|jgi:hypothetical protein|nr:hypothetical protein [Kofleriaceae bacterium]